MPDPHLLQRFSYSLCSIFELLFILRQEQMVMATIWKLASEGRVRLQNSLDKHLYIVKVWMNISEKFWGVILGNIQKPDDHYLQKKNPVLTRCRFSLLVCIPAFQTIRWRQRWGHTRFLWWGFQNTWCCSRRWACCRRRIGSSFGLQLVKALFCSLGCRWLKYTILCIYIYNIYKYVFQLTDTKIMNSWHSHLFTLA